MKSFKNFWSLNVDEAVIAGILREKLNKNIEVFMPLNAQLKDIDLLLLNLKNKKSLTIQAKGSRAYEGKKNQIERYGEGSSGWFFFPKDKILKANVDFFVFLIYVFEQKNNRGRKELKPHILAVPTPDLKRIVKKFKKVQSKNRYSFQIWINPKNNRAIDYRDNEYDLSEYLDDKGIKKLQNFFNK